MTVRSSWNGAILGSGTIATDHLTTSEMWYEFDVGTVTLNDGTTYYLQLKNSTLAGKVYLGTDDSGTYAGGDLINKDGNAEPGKDAAFHLKTVSNAPAGADNTVSTVEDTDYVFAAADFGFSDPNDSPADNFANVIITTTVANGTLYVDANGNGLVDGAEALSDLDTVSVADITAGRLKFNPAANAYGTGYDSFTFQVVDDGAGADTDLTANTMTLDVTAVNDAPVIITNTGINVPEEASVTITSAHLETTDADNTPDEIV